MIGKEDMDRLFTELNGTLKETEDAWKDNFSKEGYEFLLQIVPGTLGRLIEDCNSPREVMATFAALWVGGVRFGWELKEQYDTTDTDTSVGPQEAV